MSAKSLSYFDTVYPSHSEQTAQSLSVSALLRERGKVGVYFLPDSWGQKLKEISPIEVKTVGWRSSEELNMNKFQMHIVLETHR